MASSVDAARLAGRGGLSRIVAPARRPANGGGTEPRERGTKRGRERRAGARREEGIDRPRSSGGSIEGAADLLFTAMWRTRGIIIAQIEGRAPGRSVLRRRIRVRPPAKRAVSPASAKGHYVRFATKRQIRKRMLQRQIRIHVAHGAAEAFGVTHVMATFAPLTGHPFTRTATNLPSRASTDGRIRGRLIGASMQWRERHLRHVQRVQVRGSSRIEGCEHVGTPSSPDVARAPH